MRRSATAIYDAALVRACAGHDATLWTATTSGAAGRVDLARWSGRLIPGDGGIVARCAGPTLDLGCGPGRLALAVAERGIPALGVDLSPTAVELARARGAAALHRSVFDRLPGEGRWAHVLLADGNVGIGGDPAALLRRCRRLLGPAGTVLVETQPPGTGLDRVRLRLCDGNTTSAAFPWAFVAADELPAVAWSVRLVVDGSWTEADRWFAALRAG